MPDNKFNVISFDEAHNTDISAQKALEILPLLNGLTMAQINGVIERVKQQIEGFVPIKILSDSQE